MRHVLFKKISKFLVKKRQSRWPRLQKPRAKPPPPPHLLPCLPKDEIRAKPDRWDIRGLYSRLRAQKSTRCKLPRQAIRFAKSERKNLRQLQKLQRLNESVHSVACTTNRPSPEGQIENYWRVFGDSSGKTDLRVMVSRLGWFRSKESTGRERRVGEPPICAGSAISFLKKQIAALQPRHTNIRRDLLMIRKKRPNNKNPVATNAACPAHQRKIGRLGGKIQASDPASSKMVSPCRIRWLSKMLTFMSLQRYNQSFWKFLLCSCLAFVKCISTFAPAFSKTINLCKNRQDFWKKLTRLAKAWRQKRRDVRVV